MSEEFFVTFTRDFQYSADKDEGRQLRLSLQESISPITLPRSHWGKELDSNGIVWAAGGGTYLINGRYIPLIRRDVSAKTNSGKLTIATGLSDCEAELKEPCLLIRELFEELLMVDGEKLIVPQIQDKKINDQIEDWICSAARKAKIPYEGIKKIIGVQAANYQDSVSVESKQGCHEVKCVLSYHPPMSINVLFLIGITVEDFESIKFLDSETIVSNGERRNLNREIFFFDMEKELLLDGKMRFYSGNGLEFTPHAEDMIKFCKENKK